MEMVLCYLIICYPEAENKDAEMFIVKWGRWSQELMGHISVKLFASPYSL